MPSSSHSKNSRIDTLMKNLNIHRKFNGDISLVDEEINYDLVDKGIESLQKNAKVYLSNALSCKM